MGVLTAAALLARLADAGGTVRTVGDRLRYEGPPLGDGDRRLLAENREALLDLLGRRRFTAAELRELGFAGEPDGTGGYVVRPRDPEEEGPGSPLLHDEPLPERRPRTWPSPD